MLDFDDEIVEFKFKGEKHKISKPNNGQIKSYSKKVSKCETDESKEQALIDFLKDLGMKDGIYEMMSPSQTKRLLETLYEAEKN